MNWNQLSTVIWLRWRLTRNQFRRAGKFNAVLSVIGTVFGVLLAIAAGVGGVCGGVFGMPLASPMATMLIWDGIVGVFLFLWAIGVMVELQRSESIDLARLLHLPVSLEGIFVMNYIASHLTMSIIVFLPAILGLCLGSVWSLGPMMLLLFPLALSFIFMVSAWTYCLRGWLIALMVNPRRRRSVIVGLTLSLVLMGQLPNLYFSVYFPRHIKESKQKAREQSVSGHKGAEWESVVPTGWIAAQNYVPVFWLPNGAMSLAEGNAWPAVLGSAGAFLLGIGGLTRAYRSTIRFYRGQETSGAVSVKTAVPGKSVQPKRRNFMERRVPFVSEEVAALALAFFRSLCRAPEVKITLFTNLVIGVLFVPLMLSRFSHGASQTTQMFYATSAAGFTFFGMLQQMFNLFGYDREGFRALVLSPAARRSVLLAKNISLAPVAFGMGVALLAVVTVMIGLPVLEVAAGLLKLGAIFLLLSVAGNLVSVWVPYRVTSGSLKPSKPPAKTILLIFLTQLAFPILMIPLFVAPLLGMASEKMGWWPAPLVDGLLSIVLLGIAILVYALALNNTAEMLEQREQNILLVVTREGE